MATLKQIQFKRSKVAGVRPTAAQLAEGELAINLKDRLIFTKDDTGAIIDLGFAKGGTIEGNVTHTGNYTQTGNYSLTGDYIQSGTFTLNGKAIFNQDIQANGQFLNTAGELVVKSSGTDHLRFWDADNRERGIIFSPANTGLATQVINIRVQDYLAGTENTFAFNGDGKFVAPEVNIWRSLSSPQILTDKVITNGKAVGSYDIYSLNDNVPLSEAATAINHLRVMRNAVGAGIFHEVKDNDGITWYTGDGLDEYIWSFNWNGGIKASHSLSVGLPGERTNYSELGEASIAIGDNDTGLQWHQDGFFFTVNNGTRTLLTSPTEVTSLRLFVAGYSSNGTDLGLPPSPNYPLATIVTYHDGNNFGDGQTQLGYYDGTRYHHYFRGRGVTNVNTEGGLLVSPGNIDVGGGSVNIDGGSNASTLLFRGNTFGNSSVQNMTISVWGNTYTTPGGTRKNVFELSDDTTWMAYIQRMTDNSVEMALNGSLEVQNSIKVNTNPGAGGYDIQYTSKAPLYNEINDTAISKYVPIIKQKFLNSESVWSLGTEINSGTFVLHHINADGTEGHTSRFNKDGTVNFPDNVQVGGGEATIARNGNIFSDIWKTFTSAGDITNIRDAIATRVSKEGDTMTGRLTLTSGGDALVMTAGEGNSLHIRGDVAGTGNWYVGKGGGDNGLAFYSYATNGAVYITNGGEVALSPQGQGTFNFNRDRLHINGTQWTAHQGGDWASQWRQEAPVFVDFGNVGNDSYYPIIKGRSQITNEGYSSAVDFGMRRITNTWAQAIIRVGNQENGSDPQAIYEFHHNGTFYAPSLLKSQRVSAGGGDPVWGGPCIVLGDNDTGLVWESDGIYNAYCNGQGVFSFRAGLAQTFGNVSLHVNAGMYVRDNIDVNDVYIRSDRRAKSEIKLIENAQEKSKLLGGYTYLLKNTATGEIKPSAGLIAQEVQDVLPELVSEDKDTGYLRLNYNGIIGLNTATINEHTDEIKALKDEIAELKALVKQLIK